MGKFLSSVSTLLFVAGVAVCPIARAAPFAGPLQARTTPDGLWTSLVKDELNALPKRATQQNGYVRPLVYRALLLDDYLLGNVLDSAPLEDPASPLKSEWSASIIWLPMPDGTDVPFSFVEAPVMEPELAEKYPDIRTYLGNALDGSNRYVRFSYTPIGFHAYIRGKESVAIGPSESEGAYISYRVEDVGLRGQFLCEVEGELYDAALAGSPKIMFGGKLRTFRIAVACTGEYANFHGSTNETGPGSALAAIATTVGQLTTLFESEMAVRFVLVASNDQIVFTDPATDPFSGSTANSTLSDESQVAISSTIGDANFDLGHTFCTDGGGRAVLGTVCGARRADACSGTMPPEDQSFTLLVAHEIGHQFNADHTFNSTKGECGDGNRNGPTAFERGSGNTIMSYAGNCGADDYADTPDDYFHSASLEQMRSFLLASTCASTTLSGNTPPVVDAGPDFTIPKDTAFVLTAQGSDADPLDNDALAYTWEERDKGPKQSLTDFDNGQSPLFRGFRPAYNKPARTFPQLATLITDTFGDDEVLPSTGRVMKFWAVVRDFRGGYSTDQTKITIASAAGPFYVKSPNGEETLEGGKKKKIKWDVAGTHAPPINVANVRISLSIDGGNTFPTVLKSSTPNDGEQKVTIPDSPTDLGRIKIEAVENIFFDISDTYFKIVSDAFDLIDTWEVRNPSVDPDLVLSTFEFRADGTAEKCDFIADTCSEFMYTWTQTEPNMGLLVLARISHRPLIADTVGSIL